jgi:hypothetical protein
MKLTSVHRAHIGRIDAVVGDASPHAASCKDGAMIAGMEAA